MRIEWYGHSAFRLVGEGARVFIDPLGDTSAFVSHDLRIDYPPIAGVVADLLLVTHEHADHNGVETVGGDPVLLRSTAGTLDSPVGTVVAVASEHDSSAGTERGPNTIFAFTLDGVRVAHLGDFGQAALREEQAAAIGAVDLLFVPVGGRFTIGAPPENAHRYAANDPCSCCRSRNACALRIDHATFALLRMMPTSASSRATSRSPKRATASGSKPRYA